MKITKAQKAMLERIAAGEISYAQFTGGFGQRNEDKRGRPVNSTVIGNLERMGLITKISLNTRMGGPATIVRTLTEQGKEVVA